jgi:hypothetical protein
VLSLASAGDKQVQLSLGWRTGIQFDLTKTTVLFAKKIGARI